MSEELGAQIIVEAGRRQGGTTSTLVNSVIERKLGSEINVEEAQNALAWLMEQPLVRYENALAYPREAFAYTPEDDPATWSILLWETDFSLNRQAPTKRSLDRASAFLSPGGFNGERHQIPAPALPLVKYRIREAYRGLGTDEANISRWAADPGTRALVAEYTSLTEAKIKKGIATIIILKHGFNADKSHYYPKELLAREYQIFEGLKMYADHPTPSEERERPERSVRDWVGTLSNVRLDESGNIIGDAIIVKLWLQDTLAALEANNLLKEMGVSINAIGKAVNTLIEGVQTALVDHFIVARSVDFVTEAGAGGGVLLYEAVAHYDIDLIDLVALRERRPDLVEVIESEIRNQYKEGEMDKDEKDTTIATLEAQVSTVTKERDELAATAEKAENARVIAETKAVVDIAILEADLPAPAKKRLASQFLGATSDEGLTEAIAAEQAYIAVVTEVTGVKGLGDTSPDAEADSKALLEVWKRVNPDWNEKQLNIATRGR